MAINITPLQRYVKENPDLLLKSIRKQSIVQRFGDIRVYENETPGPFRWRIYDPVSNLGTCCRVPTSDLNITVKDSEAICLLDGNEYCETELAGIIRNADFRFTAGGESAGSVEELITRGQINAFIEGIDKLIFQGDKTSANTQLALYDGLLKKAAVNGVVIPDADIADMDLYSALSYALRQLPNEARRQGQIAIFVGEEIGDYLQAQYIARNWYHFNPGTYAPYSDNQLFGFGNVTIIPTPGLTGTGKVLITPLNNITYWTNRLNDMETLDWDYTKYHQKYYWRIKTIFGVDFAFDDYAVTLDISDILDNPYCPCA